MAETEILDAQGRPARVKPGPVACPRCRGTRRVASGGFGRPRPVCPACGYEWTDEDWNPGEGA